MDWLAALLRNGAFWSLILGFVGWLVQTYVPALPAPVWEFFYGIAVLVLAAWGIALPVAKEVQAMRQARAQALKDAAATKAGW